MSAILSHARLRFTARQWLWFLYSLLLAIILIAAFGVRHRMPQTPLFDGDSWGYLNPGFMKLTGGDFVHTFGRNIVYPSFIFVIICVFGHYEPICVFQHAIGLLTGVLLALAWNVLCALMGGSERKQMAGRFLGLLLVADYLLSRWPLLFEHTIRPEAVFPFFLILSFLLNFLALHATHVIARPALMRWCLGLNLVVVYVAMSLKPSMGFGVLAANLPMVFWLLRRSEPWRAKAWVMATALAVVAVVFWLPERLLASADPATKTFLPTMLFTIHAKIIHEQVLDDLRTGDTAPYTPEWLAAFNRKLESSLAGATRPESGPWPTIGINADHLIYRDSVFDPFFGPGREQEVAAFCTGYYWRTWLHRPREMLGKVYAELRLVYKVQRARRLRALFSVHDNYTGKIQRTLSYDYGYSCEFAANESVHPKLLLSRYGSEYLQKLDSLRQTRAVARQYLWVGYLNIVLGVLHIFLVALGLLGGGWLLLAAKPGDRVFVAAVWLCLLVNFAMYLSVAVAHTLDLDRYVENQRICLILSEFAVLLLLGHGLAGLRRTPTATIDAAALQPA